MARLAKGGGAGARLTMLSIMLVAVSVYLVLVKVLVYQLFLAFFLESDDDQGHEDVHKEKRKDDEKDHVVQRHFHAGPGLRPLVHVRRVHRVLEHAGKQHTATCHTLAYVNRRLTLFESAPSA